MIQNPELSPITTGLTIQSFRHSNFDFDTAVCEIIDNSLKAESNNIKIKIKSRMTSERQKPRLDEIACGDDGMGIKPSILQYCLKLGYSDKYNNRDNIGRFGVGMTFSAISICQRVEVYSKKKGGRWHYTFLDISKTINGKDPELHPVEQKNLPKEYEGLVGDNGTLVIWSNVDRMDYALNRDELVHEIGRIFRKFIGQQIIEKGKVITNPNIRQITVDGKIVSSHDPLYVTKTLKFPNDETATLEKDETIDWPIHSIDKSSTNVKSSRITIRTSILPESWRLKGVNPNAELGKSNAGSGNSPENKSRGVNKNNGISILRKGREIFYGSIAGLVHNSQVSDCFWGCEIDFEPVLDHWFSIKNIKNGAQPLDELVDALKKEMSWAIKAHRHVIQEGFDKTRDKERKSNKDKNRFSTHDEIEEEFANITSNPAVKPGQDINKNMKESAEMIHPAKQKEYFKKINSNKPYLIIENDQLKSDNNFIDIVPDIGKKVVHYNTNHPFFVNIYSRIEEIEEIGQTENSKKDDLIRLSTELRKDIDRLIYGYVEGIYRFEPEESQKIEDTVEEHMLNWSLRLRKTYK